MNFENNEKENKEVIAYTIMETKNHASNNEAYNAKTVRQKVTYTNNQRNEKIINTFQGKKTVDNPYGGGKLHINSKAAERKYGKKAARNHMAQLDHTIPLENVYSQCENNPFLTQKDIQKIANIDENLQYIDAKTNQTKKNKSNSEYIEANKDSLSVEKQNKLRNDEKKAQRAINKAKVSKTLTNANKVGLDAAKNAAGFTVATATAQNVIKVLNNEEKIDEAVFNIAVDTIKTSATAYATEIGKNIVEGEIRYAAKTIEKNTLTNQLSRNMNKFVDAGGVGTAIAIVQQVGDTVYKYIKGEITAQECVMELGEKGTSLACALVCGEVGFALGGFLGGFIGNCIVPGVGGIVGVNVGLFIGELVGNFVGYIVGSKIFNIVKDTFVNSASVERERRITMLNELAEQIATYRNNVHIAIEQANMNNYLETIECFEIIYEGIVSGSVEDVTNGLNAICQQYGTEVRFKSRSEFDKFMLE